MKHKRMFQTLSAICMSLALMAGFPVSAFAQGTEPPPAEDTTNDSNVVVEEMEATPSLTPEGNAALVDDFGGNKQLITVTTKAGNYFYILIDRANEDKETAVHFLNQVDDADLVALTEDGKAEEPPAVCTCTEKKPAGMNPAVLILVLALLGIGAFVYFKLSKNKPKTRGKDNLDDYDYGEDEEETEEAWETEESNEPDMDGDDDGDSEEETL